MSYFRDAVGHNRSGSCFNERVNCSAHCSRKLCCSGVSPERKREERGGRGKSCDALCVAVLRTCFAAIGGGGSVGDTSGYVSWYQTYAIPSALRCSTPFRTRIDESAFKMLFSSPLHLFFLVHPARDPSSQSCFATHVLQTIERERGAWRVVTPG